MVNFEPNYGIKKVSISTSTSMEQRENLSPPWEWMADF